MINLPNSLAKGENLTFALNKSLVLAAVSDSYWSDSANISKCIVVYASTEGHQRKRLEFDFSLESPTVVAEWSAKARNAFEIEEIVLIDFDSGSYTIPRASLPSGKGISFAGENGGGGSVVTQIVHNYAPNGRIRASVSSGNDLYIGGVFSAVRFMAPNAAILNSTTSENAEKDFASKFPSFDGDINCAVFYGSNVLFVGGAFSNVNGVAKAGIAKLIKIGETWSVDSSFTPSTISGNIIYDLKISGNTLIIAGFFARMTGPYDYGYCAISADTGARLWGAGWFSSPFTYRTIAIDGDWAYLGGQVGTSGDNTRLLKINISTGVIDTSFVKPTLGASNQFNSLQVSGDFLYVGGYITTPQRHILKLNKLTGTIVSDFISPITNTSASYSIQTILLDGDSLYLGGNFISVASRHNLTKISTTNGTEISEFNSGNTCRGAGFTPRVRSIMKNGSDLLVLGQFSGQSATADAVTCRNIAKLNATSGQLISDFASKDHFGDVVNEYFTGALNYGQNLIAFGNIEGWGGFDRKGVSKFKKDADGNWKIDETFVVGTGGTNVNTLALDGSDLYIGGTFTTWAGSARNRVAKLNASTGTLDPTFGVGVFTVGQTTGQFNGISNQGVNKIIVDGNSVVIAGSFTTYSKKSSTAAAGNVSSPYWIMVNKLTNTETVPSFSADNTINDVVFDEGSYYFAGNFNNWGGSACRFISKTNKTTGAKDSSWNPPSTYTATGSGDFASRLLVTGNRVFVGSYTQAVNGVSGAGGVFVLDKTTGSVLMTYQATLFGGSSSRVTVGKLLEDDTYVYICTGRDYTNLNISFRRIRKSDLAFDSSWGFFNTYMRITSAEIFGTEIVLTVEGTLFSLLPVGKRLYSMNATTGLQKTNI